MNQSGDSCTWTESSPSAERPYRALRSETWAGQSSAKAPSKRLRISVSHGSGAIIGSPSIGQGHPLNAWRPSFPAYPTQGQAARGLRSLLMALDAIVLPKVHNRL